MRSSLSFCRNLSVAGVLVLLFVSLASAYTLVMRGGKRIQIPDRFTLTPTVLTYQTSPGMNVTLQLAAIDIAETERANGEPAGSFIRRMHTATTVDANTEAQSVANDPRHIRNVTNRELEPYARARRESEREYERTRKELGFPSLEELRLRAERESVLAHEFVERRSRELDEESEWRRRAAELERRIDAIEAIDSQRNSDNFQYPAGAFYWPTDLFSVSSGLSDFGRSRFGFGHGFNRGFFSRRSRIFVAPGGATFFGGRFGGGPVRRPGFGRH
jgi:hypothetical protein